jgi:hypothetical protein
VRQNSLRTPTTRGERNRNPFAPEPQWEFRRIFDAPQQEMTEAQREQIRADVMGSQMRAIAQSGVFDRDPEGLMQAIGMAARSSRASGTDVSELEGMSTSNLRQMSQVNDPGLIARLKDRFGDDYLLHIIRILRERE